MEVDGEAALAHGVEHAPDHGKALLANDDHSDGRGQHEQAQRRPETDRLADLDQHRYLEQRQPEEDQHQEEAHGRHHLRLFISR